ncbi:unnamed protein product [Owenia fusiformis]|uniref:Uncharacterized protein n=1 Tax=Owenia fusiformis TaxID=6347 RepID=A0A8J1XIX5_OWEFU|nr:unnamed protein product [Owenia fusiformis]
MAGVLRGRETVVEATTIYDYYERKINNTPGTAGLEAIRYNGRSITHGKLNAKANILAKAILKRIESSSGTVDPIIGVFIQPSDARIIAILSIFKLGAGYVPLDPVLPAERIKHIVNEAKPLCIIASKENKTLFNNVEILGVDVFEISELLDNEESISGDNLIPKERLSNAKDPLACVLYTSGSTGTPKGVKLRHSNVMNRLMWQWETLPFKKDDVACAKTSILFVDSLTEAFSALLATVPIVIVPKSDTQNPEIFVNILSENKITRLVVVPSLLKNILLYLQLKQDSTSLKQLRVVVTSGEILPSLLLTEFFKAFPTGCILANLYGSTETTGDITAELFTSDDITNKITNGKVKIGSPIDNCNVYLLDTDMKPVQDGELGEMFFSGANISEGYMDREKMVQFVANMISPSPNHEILFRSGDFGRIIDGGILYEGRQDAQVKIRGHRVNLTEIENVVLRVNGVDKAVVIAHETNESNKVLVAFFTCLTGEDLTEVVRTKCKENVPTYMVPQVEQLDTMPLQSHTGKVDRVNLKVRFAAKYAKAKDDDDAVKMPDPVADVIFSVIAKELGIFKTSLNYEDNFFNVGGNSVNAMSVLMKLKTHGVSIGITDFIKATSLREVVQLAKSSTGNIASSIPPGKYIVRLLNDDPNLEEAVRLNAENFCSKEFMTEYLKIPVDMFVNFVNNFMPQVLEERLSITVRDANTGTLLGATFNVTTEGESDVVWPDKMLPIAAFLEQGEGPLKEKTAELGGKWVASFVAGTNLSLSFKENLELMWLMENESLKIARDAGYDGFTSVNTHYVTCDMAEHTFGYTVVSVNKVKDFIYDGKQVFSGLPDDLYGKGAYIQLKTAQIENT